MFVVMFCVIQAKNYTRPVLLWTFVYSEVPVSLMTVWSNLKSLHSSLTWKSWTFIRTSSIRPSSILNDTSYSFAGSNHHITVRIRFASIDMSWRVPHSCDQPNSNRRNLTRTRLSQYVVVEILVIVLEVTIH
jgi:hypothetical protein